MISTSKLPAPIRRVVENEENALAAGVAWLLGFTVLPIFGFYLGTIFGSEHTIDLQPSEMVKGFTGAGIGLAVGVVIALLATFYYPLINKDEPEAH